MSTPTLTHDQYDTLLKEAGIYGAVALKPMLLTAYDGTPEEVAQTEAKTKGLRVMFLNVATTHMYTDRQGNVIIVFPMHINYDTIDAIYPVEHKPWLYTIVDHADEDLDERLYFWRDGRDEDDGNYALPRFDLEDWRTH